MREEASSFWQEYRSLIVKRSEDMDSCNRLIKADDLSASASLGHESGCHFNVFVGYRED